MSRIGAMILLAMTAAGCSQILDAVPNPVDKAPTLAAVSPNLKQVATDAKLNAPLEAAGPIEARPQTVAPWIFCVRSKSPDQARQIYALFYRDGKLVSSRLSAIVDRCEDQTYAPL